MLHEVPHMNEKGWVPMHPPLNKSINNQFPKQLTPNQDFVFLLS